MSDLQINLPWTLYPKQTEILHWRPTAPANGPAVGVLAVLGGLGSGKTYAAIMRMVLHACLNGWHPGYGEDDPRMCIMRPTARGLHDDLIPRYRRLLPRELIVKEYKMPFPRWVLANGVHLLFMSGDSDAWSGMDFCGMHLDECDMPPFDDANRFTDMMMRLRDANATEMLMLCSGKAALGFVHDTFNLEGLSPEARFNRATFLLGTNDNVFLPPESRKQALSQTPSHYQAALVGGGWLPTAGSLFPMFVEAKHMVPDARADAHAPCHVGIDAGVSSSAVVAQETLVTLRDGSTARGALVVADLVRYGSSLHDLCMAVRTGPFGDRLVPTKSKVLCDPTIRDEELHAIQAAFPGFHVICRTRGDDLYKNEAGFRTVQAGLEDANQDVRVQFCTGIKATGKGGVYDGLLKAKINERTGSISTTYKYHSIDALKYVLTYLLGPEPPQPKHFRAR